MGTQIARDRHAGKGMHLLAATTTSSSRTTTTGHTCATEMVIPALAERSIQRAKCRGAGAESLVLVPRQQDVTRPAADGALRADL